jgi:HD-GYP domain-containing protein (c-di-GMP phosphodiesterase class II)
VSRIIAVADAFDAMTTARAFREPIPLETALEEIRRHARAQFDPTASAAFASIPLTRLAEISRFYDTRSVPGSSNGTPEGTRTPARSFAGVK